MELSGLTKLFEFDETLSRAKTKKAKWMSNIKDDIDATGITPSGITDRGNLRHNVFDWTVGQMRRPEKFGLMRGK